MTTELAVTRFDPEPGALYSLDVTAHLAGTRRRTILVYWRAGLIRPVVEPPFGALYFDDEAIHAIRRAECFRSLYGLNITGVRMVFDLLDELDDLRKEVRFLRGA